MMNNVKVAETTKKIKLPPKAVALKYWTKNEIARNIASAADTATVIFFEPNPLNSLFIAKILNCSLVYHLPANNPKTNPKHKPKTTTANENGLIGLKIGISISKRTLPKKSGVIRIIPARVASNALVPI